MSRLFVLAFIVLACFRVDAGLGSSTCIEATFEVRAKWRGECFSREVQKYGKEKRTVDCSREYAERFCG